MGGKRRRSGIRSATIPVKQITKEQRRLWRALYPEADTNYWRPATRSDCAMVARPCPFVACKHHLYLDINPLTGSIKLNFPDKEPWELHESCALDVAERGGITLEEVGHLFNLTRERIRQVEIRCLAKLRPGLRPVGSPDHEDEVDMVRAYLPEWLRQGWW